MNYKIGILNIGVNNLKSLNSFFSKFGKTTLINEKNFNLYLKEIDLLIIPGNGNFAFGSDYLTTNKMIDQIKIFKKKILGICLGMQLLFEESEESPGYKGLALLEGNVRKIVSKNIKLPLLGWYTCVDKKNYKKNFFFNNSFSCNPADKNVIIQQIDTDIEPLVSFVKYKNIYGMQFHPEKSSVNGYRLVERIINE